MKNPLNQYITDDELIGFCVYLDNYFLDTDYVDVTFMVSEIRRLSMIAGSISNVALFAVAAVLIQEYVLEHYEYTGRTQMGANDYRFHVAVPLPPKPQPEQYEQFHFGLINVSDSYINVSSQEVEMMEKYLV